MHALLSSFRAALRVVDPAAAVRRAVKVKDGGAALDIAGELVPMDGVRRIFVLGAGKAAPQMVAGLAEQVSACGKGVCGHIITKHGHAAGVALPDWCEVTEASHPVPCEAGVAGTRRVLELAESAGENDVVVAVVSGGGSALLTAPSGRTASDGSSVDLGALRATTGRLLRCGASIDEVNAVRSVLDTVKGGGLARAVWPARLVTLLVSDVVGDRVGVIASGPTVLPGRTRPTASRSEPPTPEGTTAHREAGAAEPAVSAALRVLRRRGLLTTRMEAAARGGRDGGGAAVSDWPDDWLPRCVVEAVMAAPREQHGPGEPGAAPAGPGPEYGSVHIVASNAAAVEAMLEALPGVTPVVLTSRAEGDAAELGRLLVRTARHKVEGGVGAPAGAAPFVVMAAGETTVTMAPDAEPGKGGRNQHMALAASLELEAWAREDAASAARCVFLAAGTDGTDGPTDAAGGMVSSTTAGAARAAGRDPEASLAAFDAYHALAAAGTTRPGDDEPARAGGLLITGPTGTNVMDVYACLCEAEATG